MNKYLMPIVPFLLSNSITNAALTLEIFGTPGSAEVRYSAGGTLTVSGVIAADWSDPMDLGSGVSRLPNAGDWDDDYDNDLGDILGSYDSSLNDNLVLSQPIVLLLNGVQMDHTSGSGIRIPNAAQYDTIDLDPGSGTGDDVELDNTTEIIYDALADGDVLSWGPVSGTFQLESGNFEDVFTAEGVFTNAADTFQLTVTSVPEPSSAIFLSSMGALVIFRRR